ncbi:MAG: histidine kinase dimerization/phospho-acceptor domain-containing protein, partial [Chloroflexota bacterium]
MQALRHGAFNYLLKPCNLDEMKLTISRGLEKKRLAEALRDRVSELEEANRTIQTFNAQLEDRVRRATAELGDRVRDLQQSQGQLTAVVDSMQDGLIVYDGNERVLRANAFMLSLFGLAQDAIAGMPASELGRLIGEPPLGQTDLGPTGDKTDSVTFELDGPRRRFIRRMVSPVVGDGTFHGLVALYQDMTDQKEVEQLKDDFLSIASHELKTPLTSIMGYTQLLNRRLSPDVHKGGAEDVISVIEAQCRRMKRLVEDLLDVSRIERGTLETAQAAVDLGRLLASVAGKFQGTSPKHEIQVALPDRPVLVWGD